MWLEKWKQFATAVHGQRVCVCDNARRTGKATGDLYDEQAADDCALWLREQAASVSARPRRPPCMATSRDSARSFSDEEKKIYTPNNKSLNLLNS